MEILTDLQQPEQPEQEPEKSIETKQLLVTNIWKALGVRIVLGTIYIYIGLDKSGTEKRFGLFAFTLTILLSSTTETLPIFINERQILLREASSGVYLLPSYLITKTLVFIPYLLAIAIVYSASVYFLYSCFNCSNSSASIWGKKRYCIKFPQFNPKCKKYSLNKSRNSTTKETNYSQRASEEEEEEHGVVASEPLDVLLDTEARIRVRGWERVQFGGAEESHGPWRRVTGEIAVASFEKG